MTSKSKKPKKSKVDASASVQLGWSDWSKLDFTKPAKPLVVSSDAAASATAAPETNSTPKAFEKDSTQTRSSATVNSLTEARSEVASKTAPEITPEPQVLTVGALNKLIRRRLESDFSVVWLKGEISNFKSHPSGHFYFSLKDKDAQISAVMFRGYNAQLRFRPEDGMEVVVRGKITVYEPRGNYQIMCESMEPVGAGALQKAFEQLKRKLQAEGLFEPSRKRAIPTAPKHIAIVTSPSGAAIRDMLNVLARRYRAARITVVPCSVQGVKATGEIVAAIALANRLKDVDVLIVGRGGGSIEDMWSFNEEAVARAIVASRVPVISAVGHEVDFTMADFVADLRAPTPSAAAELVAKNAGELVQTIRHFERSVATAFQTKLHRWREQIRTSGRLLVDPRRRIEDAILRCDDLVDRLERSVFESIDRTRTTLEMIDERLASRLGRRLEWLKSKFVRAAALLDGLSPLRVLDRGYALVTYQDRAVTTADSVAVGSRLQVKLAKGSIEASVVAIHQGDVWNSKKS